MDRIASTKPMPKTWMAMFIMLAGFLVPMASMSTEVGREGSVNGMNPTGANSNTLVILGASYAGGWPSERPLAGYRIINKGVNGQQSFEMLERFAQDVVALKPKAVMIWGFINDVFRSNPSEIEQTLKRTRESIQAMIDHARKSGIVPILATEVTIRGKATWSEPFETMIGKLLGKSSYQDYVNGHVLQVNRWIRDLAAREGIVLLDLERVLADQQNMRKREYALPDGSHISSQGYEVLMRYSEERLRDSLERR